MARITSDVARKARGNRQQLRETMNRTAKMNRGRHRSKLGRASVRRHRTPRKVVRSSPKEDAGIVETGISLSEKDNLDQRALQHLDAILNWAVGSQADTLELEWVEGILMMSLYAGRLLAGSCERDVVVAKAIVRLVRCRAGMDQGPKGMFHWCIQGRNFNITVQKFRRSGKSCLRLKFERRARPVRRADY